MMRHPNDTIFFFLVLKTGLGGISSVPRNMGSIPGSGCWGGYGLDRIQRKKDFSPFCLKDNNDSNKVCGFVKWKDG